MDEMIKTSIEVEKEKVSRTLADFQKAMTAMIGTNSKAYVRSPSQLDTVSQEYTIADIRTIIASGDPEAMRELSRFFSRYRGIYRRIIDYYSNLLLYYTIVSPKLGEATIAKKKIKARFNKAQEFVDNLNLEVNGSYIVNRILSSGAYYGFLREYNDSVTFQDLPIQYCRTRYKNEHGINILEFDLKYFDSIRDETERKIALENFPLEVIKAYRLYSSSNLSGKSRNTISNWFIVPSHLGAAFYFRDFTPFFIAALPALVRYEESQEREADRDEEDLQKILVNEMPLDKEDEPVFSLEETAVIHNGITEMLRNNRYLDVLTSFGEIHMEQTQGGKSAISNDNTSKFGSAIFNEMGTSSELFNATGNTALRISIEKDTALMISLVSIITEWITYQLNFRLGDDKMRFDVHVLPVTIHNKKEMAGLYLNGAQYGYSKFYAGAALGIKQSNLLSLITVENDIFDLGSKMIPLQSSHTQKGDGKSEESTPPGDNKGGPGRPELDEKDKSDKTIANENSE